MKKPAWSDKQLEDLLYQMPKIEDQRDPREIYQNISLKMNKRRKTMWVMPSVATAAVLLLFIILAPTLMNSQQSAEKVEDKGGRAASQADIQMAKMDKQEDAKVGTGNEKGASKSEEEKADNEAAIDSSKQEDQNTLSTTSVVTDDDLTAVYEKDLAGNEVFTYAIPDQNALSTIPVSVLVSNDASKSKFDMFKDTMAKLQEGSWGLNDFYPLEAELDFNEDNNTVNIDLKEGHPYGTGSASVLMFTDSLEKTFGAFGAEKVAFTTEGNPGAMFGEMGEKTELNIPAFNNKAYYFFYPSEGVKPYIVPSQDGFPSIEEAFKAMKNDKENLKYKASIPESMQIKNTNASGDQLIIELEENTQINNDADSLHTLEAILLTAKDFDFETVKIQNANVEQVGSFDLEEGMKVPVAPNKRSITE